MWDLGENIICCPIVYKTISTNLCKKWNMEHGMEYGMFLKHSLNDDYVTVYAKTTGSPYIVHTV